MLLKAPSLSYDHIQVPQVTYSLSQVIEFLDINPASLINEHIVATTYAEGVLAVTGALLSIRPNHHTETVIKA